MHFLICATVALLILQVYKHGSAKPETTQETKSTNQKTIKTNKQQTNLTTRPVPVHLLETTSGRKTG